MEIDSGKKDTELSHGNLLKLSEESSECVEKPLDKKTLLMDIDNSDKAQSHQNNGNKDEDSQAQNREVSANSPSETPETNTEIASNCTTVQVFSVISSEKKKVNTQRKTFR